MWVLYEIEGHKRKLAVVLALPDGKKTDIVTQAKSDNFRNTLK